MKLAIANTETEATLLAGLNVTFGRIKKLRAALEQIETICDDNAAASCNKSMALRFVRSIAAEALAEEV